MSSNKITKATTPEKSTPGSVVQAAAANHGGNRNGGEQVLNRNRNRNREVLDVREEEEEEDPEAARLLEAGARLGREIENAEDIATLKKQVAALRLEVEEARRWSANDAMVDGLTQAVSISDSEVAAFRLENANVRSYVGRLIRSHVGLSADVTRLVNVVDRHHDFTGYLQEELAELRLSREEEESEEESDEEEEEESEDDAEDDAEDDEEEDDEAATARDGAEIARRLENMQQRDALVDGLVAAVSDLRRELGEVRDQNAILAGDLVGVRDKVRSLEEELAELRLRLSSEKGKGEE